MNELDLYKIDDFNRIKLEINKYEGYVYALEFGNLLKIGSTRNPRERLSALKRSANYAQVSIGNVLLSPIHKNYRINEKNLLEKMPNRVDGTELFNISLLDAVDIFKSLKYERITEKDNIEIEKRKKEVEAFAKTVLPVDYVQRNEAFSDTVFENILKLFDTTENIFDSRIVPLVDHILGLSIDEHDKMSILIKIMDLASVVNEMPYNLFMSLSPKD